MLGFKKISEHSIEELEQMESELSTVCEMLECLDSYTCIGTRKVYGVRQIIFERDTDNDYEINIRISKGCNRLYVTID